MHVWGYAQPLQPSLATPQASGEVWASLRRRHTGQRPTQVPRVWFREDRWASGLRIPFAPQVLAWWRTSRPEEEPIGTFRNDPGRRSFWPGSEGDVVLSFHWDIHCLVLYLDLLTQLGGSSHPRRSELY